MYEEMTELMERARYIDSIHPADSEQKKSATQAVEHWMNQSSDAIHQMEDNARKSRLEISRRKAAKTLEAGYKKKRLLERNRKKDLNEQQMEKSLKSVTAVSSPTKLSKRKSRAPTRNAPSIQIGEDPRLDDMIQVRFLEVEVLTWSMAEIIPSVFDIEHREGVHGRLRAQ